MREHFVRSAQATVGQSETRTSSNDSLPRSVTNPEKVRPCVDEGGTALVTLSHGLFQWKVETLVRGEEIDLAQFLVLDPSVAVSDSADL